MLYTQKKLWGLLSAPRCTDIVCWSTIYMRDDLNRFGLKSRKLNCFGQGFVH